MPAAETSVDRLWVLQVQAPSSVSRQHWGVSAGVCPHDMTWGAAAFGSGGEEGEEVVAGQARPQAPTSKGYALPVSLQLQEFTAERRWEGTCARQERQLQSPLGVGTQLPAPGAAPPIRPSTTPWEL